MVITVPLTRTLTVVVCAPGSTTSTTPASQKTPVAPGARRSTNVAAVPVVLVDYCFAVVEQHGQVLFVDSGAPGQGAGESTEVLAEGEGVAW
jgi:hypothetical protein